MSLFQVLKGCFFAFFSVYWSSVPSPTLFYISGRYLNIPSLIHFYISLNCSILTYCEQKLFKKKKIKNMSFGFHPLNSFSIPVQYVSYWDFQIVSISCYSISWESARTWIRIWIYSMEYVRPGFLSTKHTQDISL